VLIDYFCLHLQQFLFTVKWNTCEPPVLRDVNELTINGPLSAIAEDTVKGSMIRVSRARRVIDSSIQPNYETNVDSQVNLKRVHSPPRDSWNNANIAALSVRRERGICSIFTRVHINGPELASQRVDVVQVVCHRGVTIWAWYLDILSFHGRLVKTWIDN